MSLRLVSGQVKATTATLPHDAGVKLALPQHLEWPREEGHVYGRLERREINGVLSWVLQGEPQVIITAKRLFPGSEGKQGIAIFPLTDRSFPDLIWLMQRYRLEIGNMVDFKAAYQGAVTHWRRGQEIAARPRQATPPAVFRGHLQPFQQEGLAWCLAHKRTLLADEMGLGKTVQAIALLASARAWPALIVAPPHLMRHWQAKLAEFLNIDDAELPLMASGGLRMATLKGQKADVVPAADIYLIHYLLLSHWRHRLKELEPRAIVFDEIQELRHATSEKYSAASAICDGVEYVVGLSGTPIYNRGGEILNVLNILELHCLGSWDFFTREWCCGYDSDVVRDPYLLGSHLRREGLMLRRRKEDVLPDLPPKRRVVETVEADQGLMAELLDLARRLAADASSSLDNLERGRLELEAVNSARQATGIGKVPAVAAFLRGLLEANEPILCFAHHHAVMDGIAGALSDARPVMISGRQNMDEKAAAVRAFADGETNLCLISLRAAAGLDGMQGRARVVVFAELDWSPSVHAQAEDRAHRMGQRDSVLAYYLVSNTGTDPEMQDALGLKVSQFLGIVGDKGEDERDRALAQNATQDHMRSLLARLRKEAP